MPDNHLRPKSELMDARYSFGVGNTGDSPVSVGDSPTEMAANSPCSITNPFAQIHRQRNAPTRQRASAQAHLRRRIDQSDSIVKEHLSAIASDAKAERPALGESLVMQVVCIPHNTYTIRYALSSGDKQCLPPFPTEIGITRDHKYVIIRPRF
jgi:hypothetical protein